MSVDTTVIQARISTLEAALASGVLTVRHGDTTTTFRSAAEILLAIDRLEKQLTGPRTGPRYVQQSSKGL